ncbi:MAG TPA: Holliday junction resolvase RuvX [Candidatus Saccharibacteria bacterium]|nr:Holliday junction resolvase RuvX [Candidatus Saccharibacteria bacterium]
MSRSKQFLGLDVGTVRIGVAIGDSQVRLATPLTTLAVDGAELDKIADLVKAHNIDTVVIGYPRNQSGEATKQTELVEVFASSLQVNADTVFQDESLTSVLAEDRLKQQGGPYQKADIDKMAASILLQDYLEQHS